MKIGQDTLRSRSIITRMSSLFIIDTHTGGEPTRVVIEVQPDPSQLVGTASGPSIDLVGLADSLLAAESPLASESTGELWSWLRGPGDWVRKSILSEPRGCESMVGALVGPSDDPSNLASVVFFNNHGYLGMCGHGLIGVVEALRFSQNLQPGSYRFETPVGIVRASLASNRQVTFENVASYRYRRAVVVKVAAPAFWGAGDAEGRGDAKGAGEVEGATISLSGDIAYGGNWFYLVSLPNLNSVSRDELLRFSIAIKDALAAQGITGVNGAEIDHVEFCGPLAADSEFDDSEPDASSVRGGRNFVLCPGGHYDRSPCGTGTSAKLACLADEGSLRPGEVWVQESIIGSRFKATYRTESSAVAGLSAISGPTAISDPNDSAVSNRILASITGQAFVTGTTRCVFDPDDPFRFGLPSVQSAEPCSLTDVDDLDPTMVLAAPTASVSGVIS